jgi:hypothetical protein
MYHCPYIIDLIHNRWLAKRSDVALYEQAGNFDIVVIAMAFAIDHTTSKRVIRSTMSAADLEPGAWTDREAVHGFHFISLLLEVELEL